MKSLSEIGLHLGDECCKKNQLITTAHVARRPAVLLTFFSAPSARGHCQDVTVALLVLTASALPFGCFEVTARRTECLSWAVPLLGGARQPTKLV